MAWKLIVTSADQQMHDVVCKKKFCIIILVLKYFNDLNNRKLRELDKWFVKTFPSIKKKDHKHLLAYHSCKLDWKGHMLGVYKFCAVLRSIQFIPSINQHLKKTNFHVKFLHLYLTLNDTTEACLSSTFKWYMLWLSLKLRF